MPVSPKSKRASSSKLQETSSKSKSKSSKKPLIYHLKKDEQGICKALHRTGTMTIADARSHFSVSDRRFDAMLKEGYLTKKGDLLRLGPAGQKYLKIRLDMKHPYRSKLSTVAHDLKLNKIYLALSEEVRETWKTEGQIIREIAQDKKLYRQFKELKEDKRWKNGRANFSPDAAVYSKKAGGYVAVESVTTHYSDQDLEQKDSFANLFFKGVVHV